MRPLEARFSSLRSKAGRGAVGAAIAVLLAACGGGGDSGGSAPVVTPAAQGTVSVPALSFTSTVGATSPAQSVTLSNSGASDLSVTSIATSNPALQITGGTCAAGTSLPAGASCTVLVAFAPTAAGTATASLVITTGVTSTPLVVSLSGAASPATGPDLVTSVTAPTYPAGSIEKGAWDLLMAQRLACGFGLVQQDTRISAAASAHAVYLAQNSIDRQTTITSRTTEDPTWSYFTGATPADRTLSAGFPAGTSISEIVVSVVQIYDPMLPPPLAASEALGAAAMRPLIESIYQAVGAFNPSRTGGVGAALRTGPTTSVGFNQQQFRQVVDFSADSNPQRIGLGNLATWPCAGLAGVGGVYAPTAESPRAFPDVVDASVRYGTPIYFKADPGSTLLVTSAALTKVSDGTAVPLRQLTHANDPNTQLGTNELFLVPVSALAASSSYSVSAAGTLNGTAFTKAFTFSTGP